MTFLLGLTAYGCARILARRGGGYWLVLAASVGGMFIRPNQQMLALGGFAIAMIFRPVNSGVQLRGRTPYRRPRLSRSARGRRPLRDAPLSTRVAAARLSLSTINSDNNAPATGAGFGSSVSYSANPIFFPKDVYVVLFDPLPINAHGGGEWLDAVENTMVVGVVFASFRHLRILPRAALARPYVIMCAIFTGYIRICLRRPGQPGIDHPGGDGAAALLPRAAVRSPRPSPPSAPLRLGAAAPGPHRTPEGAGPPRRCRRARPSGSHLSAHHRLEGGLPPLGHEVQGERRFAPPPGRGPHRCQAVRVVQELSDRCGQRGNRVVDDHPGLAVAQHGGSPGRGGRHGRKAAQACLDEHSGQALTSGPAGEHEHVRTAEELGHVRTRTEELDPFGRRQRGQGAGERAVADDQGRGQRGPQPASGAPPRRICRAVSGSSGHPRR